MHYIMRRINTITRCSLLYRAERLSKDDINPCHHGYFLAISRNPGISQEELAKHLCINKSNVTRSLARLEKDGYIRRTPNDADKRVINVHPTEKLNRILPQIRSIAHDWNAYLTDGLTDEEMELFHSVLDRIYEKARQYSEEAGK